MQVFYTFEESQAVLMKEVQANTSSGQFLLCIMYTPAFHVVLGKGWHVQYLPLLFNAKAELNQAAWSHPHVHGKTLTTSTDLVHFRQVLEHTSIYYKTTEDYFQYGDIISVLYSSHACQ